MKTIDDTRQIYNAQAEQWTRDEPILLSDYSARPFLLELCEPISGSSILDLGCGEGYVARELMKRGAKQAHGIDISEKMIDAANHQQSQFPRKGLSFAVGDLRQKIPIDKGAHDLVVAVFLFNYLTLEETQQTMQNAFTSLKSGGRLIFAVPHPALPFLKKDQFPFYFESAGGYFSGRDQRFPGEIWRRDRVPVRVQCVHKTIEDYFHCLKQAGFRLLPDVHELKITNDHVELDPEFFEPLLDLPLHLAFQIEKQ
ncbi:class I SAM-dependent methyltransferase [Pirellulaceae bacterium]|jgi:SAM-dependent methyltransferase|nr:class I SAM-dependent methyltransferase [Mariniblastus sp.]MDB4756430.1 class I SAM-dependent methyltransferase [Mariniblastus sp.]MDB4794337.1 class I SAM-dependent methyltransferase [Pirellulaceae bacterium]